MRLLKYITFYDYLLNRFLSNWSPWKLQFGKMKNKIKITSPVYQIELNNFGHMPGSL